MLKNHLGQPRMVAAGVVLTDGSAVIDVMFGEGIARGVVPLEKGRRCQCSNRLARTKLDASLDDNHVYMLLLSLKSATEISSLEIS